MNNIIIQSTTPEQLKALIIAGVAEALESLREELKEASVSKKLTRQQVKEEFQISFPTILKLEKLGKLKGYRIGRRVLFDREDVQKALIIRKFS
ncbi:DNA-binding protein [Bacteroidia bacterium]|nr:DNA-binding protein [Bacteroidia bacterium]